MIKVYFLPVQTVNGTETVKGIDIIHNAILETAEIPTIRMLIMDTTPEEHISLSTLATQVRDPTPLELENFHALELAPPPNPDIIRLQEILATSSEAISMPEVWEALRLLGRLHGIPT